MKESDNGAIEPPDIGNWLDGMISVRRDEYERQFAGVDETDSLIHAQDALRKHAAELVLTGVLPFEVQAQLEHFQPGDPVGLKIRELLLYSVIHHRLEFDIADDVVFRLTDLNSRIRLVSVLTAIVIGYMPSESAVKYFRRATSLYLAGYEAESVIMCGAVLEAALRARFPDDSLAAHGSKPRYSKSKDYSIGQRMRHEKENPIFTESQRAAAVQLVNWRNDAVHVQPDVTPSADRALMNLAVILPIIFPGE
jgi:hypothetical protein